MVVVLGPSSGLDFLANLIQLNGRTPPYCLRREAYNFQADCFERFVFCPPSSGDCLCC